MAKRGSRPGERRGGRKKGTRNGLTVNKLAKLGALTGDVERDIARVKAEYSHIAFLDIRQAFDSSGQLKPIDEWPDDLARAVCGVEVIEMGDDGARFRLHKIKICSKISALEHIGRHLGMFAKAADGSDIRDRITVVLERAAGD